jgi:hypothetical protein
MTLSAKEHKFQFQFSTNTHEALARIMFGSYVALAVLAMPMVRWQGMMGFLYTWLAIELFQVIRIVGLNRQLFAHTGEHRLHYLFRLTAACVVALPAAGWLLAHTDHSSYPLQIGVALAVSAALMAITFWLFHLRPIAGKLLVRLRTRLAAG